MIATSLVRRAAGAARRRYRGSDLRWHLRNARAELAYRLSRPALSAAEARVVAMLDRDGLAMIEVDELVPRELTGRLYAAVDHEEAARASELVAARAGEGEHYKSRYRFSLLGVQPRWEPTSAFAQFSSCAQLRNVASAYYGLEPRLRYYNVWRTFPVDDPPGDSQLWHRDQDDRLILKAFLYLSDVTPDAGPLTYVPGTHRKGHVRLAPQRFKEQGHGNWRSTDDQLAQVMPRERWREATGPRGTLVFVDTAGFHKGGFSRSQERSVFTCMFTSPIAEDGDLFAPSTPVSR